MTTNTHDAIVIGAGFGGAACAALLSQRGFKVLLVEKNNLSGGKAMTLNKKGFTYSAWPVMGAPVQENQCQRLVDTLGVGERVKLTASEAGSYYKTAKQASTSRCRKWMAVSIPSRCLAGWASAWNPLNRPWVSSAR